MLFNVLWRVSAWSPPGVAQWSGFLARSVTSSPLATPQMPPSANTAHSILSRRSDSNCIQVSPQSLALYLFSAHHRCPTSRRGRCGYRRRLNFVATVVVFQWTAHAPRKLTVGSFPYICRTFSYPVYI